jgi:anti-sigma B factor antagonist
MMPVMTGEMQTSIGLSEGVATVFVVGEIDIAVVHDLAGVIDNVLGKGLPTLVVDLSAVTFCDSSGLGQFLHAADECTNLGVEFRIVGANQNVRKVFELTETTDLLGG